MTDSVNPRLLIQNVSEEESYRQQYVRNRQVRKEWLDRVEGVTDDAFSDRSPFGSNIMVGKETYNDGGKDWKGAIHWDESMKDISYHVEAPAELEAQIQDAAASVLTTLAPGEEGTDGTIYAQSTHIPKDDDESDFEYSQRVKALYLGTPTNRDTR